MLSPKQKRYLRDFSRLPADVNRLNLALDVLARREPSVCDTSGQERLSILRDNLMDEQERHPLMDFLNQNVK